MRGAFRIKSLAPGWNRRLLLVVAVVVVVVVVLLQTIGPFMRRPSEPNDEPLFLRPTSIIGKGCDQYNPAVISLRLYNSVK
jgi:hypothetical protein